MNSIYIHNIVITGYSLQSIKRLVDNLGGKRLWSEGRMLGCSGLENWWESKNHKQPILYCGELKIDGTIELEVLIYCLK